MIHCESESAVLRTRFPESLVICRCRFTVSVVKVKVKMKVLNYHMR